MTIFLCVYLHQEKALPGVIRDNFFQGFSFHFFPQNGKGTEIEGSKFEIQPV